jgi:opacity protein-like surface antigen
MWKKLLVPVLVFGAVSAMAGSSDFSASPSKVFVGVQLGKAWVQGTHESDLNYKTDGLSYGIRLGAQNQEWRTMVTFDRFKNDEASYERGEIHADYLFHFDMDSMGVGIVPFIGLNGGYANYEAKGGINESGWTYGGEAGVIFDVSENIDVDVMYQYTIGAADAFDHVGNLKVGINYKY